LEEDALLAVDFLDVDFRDGFAAVPRAEDFFAVDLPVVDFFAVDFFAVDFFAVDFAGERRLVVFADVFFAGCRFFDAEACRFFSLASAVPPTAAPTAAALAAASTGFSATTDTTFFAPLPTAEAASPAFSVTVSNPDCSFSSIMSPPRIVVH
jgi:hypothetical protein